MTTAKSITENYLNCVGGVLHSAVKRGHLERVKLLVEHGADVQAIDSDGVTLVTVALQNGHQLVADYLLECGELKQPKQLGLGMSLMRGKPRSMKF